MEFHSAVMSQKYVELCSKRIGSWVFSGASAPLYPPAVFAPVLTKFLWEWQKPRGYSM